LSSGKFVIVLPGSGLYSATSGPHSWKFNPHLFLPLPPNPPSRLCRPKSKRVVLLVHPHGVLLTSLVLDMPYADIPRPLLSCSGVYTFGNSSNTFYDPLYQHDDPESGTLNTMPIAGSMLTGLEPWDLSRLGVVGGFGRVLEYRDGGLAE